MYKKGASEHTNTVLLAIIGVIALIGLVLVFRGGTTGAVVVDNDIIPNGGPVSVLQQQVAKLNSMTKADHIAYAALPSDAVVYNRDGYYTDSIKLGPTKNGGQATLTVRKTGPTSYSIVTNPTGDPQYQVFVSSVLAGPLVSTVDLGTTGKFFTHVKDLSNGVTIVSQFTYQISAGGTLVAFWNNGFVQASAGTDFVNPSIGAE